MGEWMDIEHWPECARIERPGIVFELRNKDGQSLFTPCVVPVPDPPFDWASPPQEFRAVAEEEPMHSTPLPKPQR